MTSTPPYRTVIDCDPGRDDALAILGALGSPTLDVEFITTVAGNLPLDRTTDNALRVLALAGAGDVPVYRGADRPLYKTITTGANTHGDFGQDDPGPPPPLHPPAGEANPALRHWCKESSDVPKRIIAIGPMTNLGTLLVSDPEALSGVEDIFIMGGTVSQMETRVSPSAEFNFYTDPDAANLVMQSGVNIWLYDYDLTTSCQIPTSAVDHIEQSIAAPIGAFVGDWLRNLWEYSNKVYGRQGIAIHDMYAAAGAAGHQPDRWEHYHFRVDTSEERRGTIFSTPDPTGQSRQAVARGLHPDDMIEFLIESANRLPAVGS